MSHVDVIIPCYDDPKLKATVDSLLSQVEVNLTITIVDDCSSLPVDSLEFPECKVLRHQVNRGPGAARNTGVANTSSEYVFFCDSDVDMQLDGIKSLVSVMDQSPNDVSVVYGDFIWDGKDCKLGPYDYQTMLKGNQISPMSLIRRSAMVEFKDGYWEDWDFFLRLLNTEKHPNRIALYMPKLIFVTNGRRRSLNPPEARGTPDGVVLV